MGLFYHNYSKAGPGVSKNEREKKRFFLFLDLLGRKCSKLIFLNIIYCITLIPLFLGLRLSVVFNPLIISDGVLNAANLGKAPLFILTGDIIGIICIFVSLFLTAPATCGFTYVLRNMQRQEHTWVFSDFREHFAKNFKQAFVIGVIDIVAALVLYFAYTFYAYSIPLLWPDSSLISSLGSYFIIIASLLFVIMHYYIFVMMVTFDLNIRSIMKNAAIFTISKMPLNLFLTIILATVVLVSAIYAYVGIICIMVITLSFCGFVIVFGVYPTIEKYMIDVQKNEPDDSEKADVRDFEDTSL